MKQQLLGYILPFIAGSILLGGCYWMRGSSGGGQTPWQPPRIVNADDIALPDEYRIEPVAIGLTFPTGVTFDAEGRPYVVESGYSYGEVFTIPKLLRVEADGSTTTIASGENNGPWTGVVWHDGAFYVAEGGVMKGGRILRITPDGAITSLVEGLPSFGDHHTNGPVVGSDGYLYFAQGSATNSAVVGEDNAKFGWLRRRPDFHDIPCRDVTLTGVNYTTDNPLTPQSDQASTGAYLPFGTPSTAGQVIRGRVPCSGAIMRVPLKGGEPELVAWGLRNPFGLAFAPDGELFATENSYDERGSRPVWGTGDCLWRIRPGTWYGWPDFSAGEKVDVRHFTPPGDENVRPLLAQHPGQPPQPVAIFGVHSSADGLDFSRNASFGHVGQAFVALLGDEAPAVGKVLHPVGFKVVRVNVNTGVIDDFAVNINSEANGPASWIGSGGLERPVAVRFDPAGTALYVVDFGVLLHDSQGAKPKTGTGVVWKITRK